MAWRWRFSLSLSVPTLATDELHADDMQAVCNAYPPGRETAFKCDGLPRPGYSLECADVQQGLRQVLARHRRELRWHARLGAARRAAVAPRAQATTPDSLAPLHVALPAAFPLSPGPFPPISGERGVFPASPRRALGQRSRLQHGLLAQSCSARACVDGGGKKAAKADSAAVGRT